MALGQWRHLDLVGRLEGCFAGGKVLEDWWYSTRLHRRSDVASSLVIPRSSRGRIFRHPGLCYFLERYHEDLNVLTRWITSGAQ